MLNSTLEEFHGQEKFVTITSVLSVINVVSIILNSVLVRFQLTVSGMDLSIKILSFNLAVSYILSNLFLLVKSAMLHSQTIWSISGTQCLVQEFPVILGYVCATYSLAAIVLDRWIATRMRESYRNFCVKLAIVNTIISWMVATTVHFTNFFFPFSFEQLPVCLSVLFGNQYYVTIVLGFNSLLNWVVFLSYQRLVSANCAMLRDFLDSQLYISLSGRLQLRRNIAVAKSLLPTILSSALLWLLAEFYILFSMYMREWTDFNTTIAVAYCNHILCALHSIVYPIIVFYRSRSLRVAAHNSFKRLMMNLNWWKSGEPNADANYFVSFNGEVYFENLNSDWNTTFAQKQRKQGHWFEINEICRNCGNE